MAEGVRLSVLARNGPSSPLVAPGTGRPTEVEQEENANTLDCPVLRRRGFMVSDLNAGRDAC